MPTNKTGTVAVTVVGIHGGAPYGQRALDAVGTAAVVVGSPRQLHAAAALLHPGAIRLPLVGPLRSVIARIETHAAAGSDVCVLASGDPGFFGIVRSLGEHLGADRLRVHPAPSSVSLAFARVGVSWDDALVVSAHGRPLADAAAAVIASDASSVAVLTAPDVPPQAIGRALMDLGERAADVTVASNLGDADETITRTDLAGLVAGDFDPMSVVLLRRRGDRGPVGALPPTLAWGRTGVTFAHRDGMVTKAEVRAVALGKLALPRSGVVWDVGAGSGSVGIECAALSPALQVFAVDRDAAQCARVADNAAALGVRVEVVHGDAPDVLAGLPDPDRVFVGGGGSQVLDGVLDRLRPDGVVVATYALLGRAAAAGERLGNLVEVAVARGVTTGTLGLRLRAENPVFVCWGPGA